MTDDRGPAGRCPLCGKPRQAAFRPFCSRRCKDLDLARWIGGNYRIAGQNAYDDDGDPAVGEAPPDGSGPG